MIILKGVNLEAKEMIAFSSVFGDDIFNLPATIAFENLDPEYP